MLLVSELSSGCCSYLYAVVGLLIELVYLAQLQLKRLKLRKNNWDADTYEFDEVLTEFSSQKRVYEVVARPVVEVGIHPPVLWVQALVIC